MWTYILRRLLVMIPTLLGVTIVAFLIMQLAPGDPLANQLGAAGLAGQSSQTREAYLIRKRDFKLDKPLFLNFNYFLDWSEEIRIAAHFLGATEAEIAATLEKMAGSPPGDATPEAAARRRFIRGLEIQDFEDRLQDPEQRPHLATAVQGLTRIYCEDAGVHGVPPAVDILRSDNAPEELKLGAIRALNHMVIDPFAYTYSREPSEDETPAVTATWSLWWERAQADFPELDPERREALQGRFRAILDAGSRREMFDRLSWFDPERNEPFQRADMRLFVEKLLGESTLREKVIASLALRLYLGKPLRTDVPAAPDAGEPEGEGPAPESPDAPGAPDAAESRAELIREVTENWLVHFRLHRDEYEPGPGAKTAYIFTDTQYANMLWRLLTFQFGRSTVKTREPVATKILDAVLISAPLMILAQIVIYLVAVPAGIVCAVNRDNFWDRSISLVLFLLYSIPPFVAGMLLLLWLSFNVGIFPANGLHSDMAESYGFFAYLVDYLWHIILPVGCLSLFSLAGMAMYSRTSMLEVIGQDYIRTARAKGLDEDSVVFKHGLRNSLIPIITLFASFLPAMLGGSVLIEYIFGIPGMGYLSWESILLKDIPTLMALLYIDAIVVMLSILMSDILYVIVDPRISFEAQEQAG